MKYLLNFIFCLAAFTGRSQLSFSQYIQPGPYTAGFYDTIIYNPAQPYSAHGYTGDAPIFIQVWHPVKTTQAGTFLTFADLRKRTVPPNLQVVYDTLCAQMDKSMLEYNISKDFVSYRPIDYSPHTALDVLQAIKSYTTNSTRAVPDKNNDFPVIVYHHGAQGLPDENFVMAEYFASRGYIFVSASYHLPYEKLSHGSTSGKVDVLSFPKTVSEYARKLTHSSELYYIGHSWGAQNGFRYLFEKGWASAFVSLETTIEFKEDTSKIKTIWPEIHDLLVRQKKTYPLPVLMVANTRQNKPFWFFKDIGGSPLYFASAKAEFGHESYTSTAHLRYLYSQTFRQPDTKEMRAQLKLYAEHLQLVEAFLQSVQKNIVMDRSVFRKHFYINN